jgi:hypothetical protein
MTPAKPTRRTMIALAAAAPALAATSATAQALPEGATPDHPPARPPAAPLHDGAADFDFVIGDWKAHVRRLPERLVGSTAWIEYEGTSSHRKLFGGPANLEEFKVRSLDGKLTMHGQTLRLYNRETRQWSIYLVDAAEGTLGLPPVIGGLRDGVMELYDQELWKGRAILVRYHWFNLSPLACRMEQAFSADGGRSWETNWICELTRDRVQESRSWS